MLTELAGQERVEGVEAFLLKAAIQENVDDLPLLLALEPKPATETAMSESSRGAQPARQAGQRGAGERRRGSQDGCHGGPVLAPGSFIPWEANRKMNYPLPEKAVVRAHGGLKNLTIAATAPGRF